MKACINDTSLYVFGTLLLILSPCLAKPSAVVQGIVINIVFIYTANVYRQTTDKLLFKSDISTVR